jgi:hypothetical protein
MSKNSRPRHSRRHPLAAAAVIAITAFAGLAGLSSTALAAGTTPLISNQASSSGFPVGIAIFDSATLGWGANPTGAITFRLFAPWDPSCVGAPVFTWNTPVNGNGYYASGSFTTPWAGTYRWTSTYNGDANNNPVASDCGAPGAVVDVAKRTPTLSGGATSAGGAVVDSVTIGGASPTGTMTFSLYGPNNLTCAGAPIFTSTKAVWGNGQYTSDAFTPGVAGTYQWLARYSGDANNWAAGSICADAAHAVVATAGNVVSGFSLTVGPLSVKPAGVLTVTWSNIASPTAYDWIALYAVGAPNWALKAWKYTGGSASGSATMTVPWGTPPGAYEVRLFANNSYNRIGTAALTVVA